jgi:hypothetical protein
MVAPDSGADDCRGLTVCANCAGKGSRGNERKQEGRCHCRIGSGEGILVASHLSSIRCMVRELKDGEELEKWRMRWFASSNGGSVGIPKVIPSSTTTQGSGT